MPIETLPGGKRKLTESAKEFQKDSSWQSPKGPFREALKRKGMPPQRLFVQGANGEGSKVTLEVPLRLPTT